MRKRRLDAAAKEAEKKEPDKPDVEKSPVKITPYPRTGDNKEFEAILDKVGLDPKSSPESKPATPAKPAKPAGPATGDEILTVADVAEWVDAPFVFWAEINKLPGLALKPKEANSVAEPLTKILNRHGAGGLLHPDVFDTMKIAARLKPILSDRLAALKTERARRAAAADSHDPTPFVKAQRSAQGGQPTKPKEV